MSKTVSKKPRQPVRISRPMFLFFVLACVVCGILVLQKLSGDIADINHKYTQTRILQTQAQGQRDALKNEIDISESDGYIVNKAREYGMLLPGEIRFVVTNPESEDAEAQITEVGQ